MITISESAALRQALDNWREAGLKIAFVPTMGNLHEGHLSLVDAARAAADKVVVSIFVNPLQFAPDEDFDRYPRTMENDQNLLKAHQTDLLFTPSVADIYPEDDSSEQMLDVPELSNILCGRFRPGHFKGVATVVARLFELVRPHKAFFGKKDYQQLRVIQRLVQNLRMPVEVVGLPIVREADGLAMSSRNQYLSTEDRATAAKLFAYLQQAVSMIRAGQRDYPQIQAQLMQLLNKAGFAPDYVEICNPDDLTPSKSGDTQLIILAAATLGATRLIDNVEINTQA